MERRTKLAGGRGGKARTWLGLYSGGVGRLGYLTPSKPERNLGDIVVHGRRRR
jgi:hypothetical protein